MQRTALRAADAGRWADEGIGKPVARNIEIKARSTDFEKQAQIAASIADGPPALIEQTDTFFHVPHRPLTHFRGKLVGLGHGSILSDVRASSKPGAIQSQVNPLLTIIYQATPRAD